MANAQAVARAFAPFVAIEEFQNIVQLHNKTNPVFLRRNLSYSATHQERKERDQKATSIVHLYLEPLNAPAGYSNTITVIAAVCAVLPGKDPNGQDALVPLAAKVGRVRLKPPGGAGSQQNGTAYGTSPGSNGKSLGVTISMKVPFAQGILPKDIVIVLLHKRDRSISRIVRHIAKAKHRGTDWNRCGREVTCTIKDNHAFQWYKSGTNVLFATVYPSEEMMEIPPPPPAAAAEKTSNHGSSPACGSAFFIPTGTSNVAPSSSTQHGGIRSIRGTIELQPGMLHTQDPFQNDQGDVIPSNFYISNGAIGDATPMLRYSLTLEGVIPVTKKRKRDSFGGTSPRNNGRANNNNNTMKHISISSKGYPHPLTVNFCSYDGSLKISIKLQHGYSCPFESCGLRCRGNIGALHQHVLACHPYYEYFLTKSDDQGTELWVRCKKEWFGVNGAFLPASGFAVINTDNNNNNNGAMAGSVNTTHGSHPLAPLIHRTPTTLPFQYICREKQRIYRRNEGGAYPIDLTEERLEEHGAAVAEAAAAASAAAEGGHANGLFVWNNADLAPIEQPEIEKGQTEKNKLEDSGAAGNNKSGAGGGGGGRPPRAPSSRQRSGSLHLPRPQHSLLPTKLPLTDKNGLPKFYHRGRCISMTEQELEVEAADSDDDSDTEQYIRYCSTALEENPNLCKEEIDFMLTWNLYTLKNPIHADSAIPATCIAFANDHLERLRDAKGSFRRCFVAHVLNFWRFRLLTPAQMHQALLAAGGGR